MAMPSGKITGRAAERGADVLAGSLIAAGVRTLFGVPGDTGVTFYDALRRRSREIRHVLVRDERHAAAAADAYARVSNTAGVAEVSSGGGVTYVVGGLGEAYAASVPLLLITSDIHRRSRGTGALTEIDQETLLRAVTKWQLTVNDARQIPEAVAEALRQATSGRPAPVALIVPEDVLDATVPAPPCQDLRPGAVTLPRDRTEAPAGAVETAARHLAGAEWPAMLVGSGAHVSGAYRPLRLLAERAGIAVATTIHGKGTIPDSSACALGVAGNNGARSYANDYLASADVVLLVGTRANATDTNMWRGPARDGRATVIQIDIEPARAGRNFPGSLGLAGDAGTVLGQFLRAVPADAARRERVTGSIREARRRWETEHISGAVSGPGALAASGVVRALGESLGPDTLVIADPGTPTPNVAAYWETTRPGRTVIVPRGHGPMGYAIPAAVGAAFARPGRPVLVLTADGSFAMSCGELETVARFGLPVVFVQFTNFSLGWIKMLQHLYFGRRYFGVDPGPIDAPQVARAAGIEGVHVTSLDELKAVVTGAVASLTPVYVDVTVPPLTDDVPPVSSWHDAMSGSHERPAY
jgi:acetolactate synthase-1/2/3 large subunit